MMMNILRSYGSEYLGWNINCSIPKIEFIAYITFYYKYLKYKNNF